MALICQIVASVFFLKILAYVEEDSQITTRFLRDRMQAMILPADRLANLCQEAISSSWQCTYHFRQKNNNQTCATIQSTIHHGWLQMAMRCQHQAGAYRKGYSLSPNLFTTKIMKSEFKIFDQSRHQESRNRID